MQNLFADKEPLKQANSNYMALMLGSEGILPKKATPEQINLMVDGCITAGIIDHLYGFSPKEAEFRDQITKFSGYKRLDIQLAYAFYMIGYSAPDYADLKTLIATALPLEPNFDHEFTSICAQVYSRGNIIEYRNRLEDVIKSTSKPFSFDDFVQIHERRAELPSQPSTQSNISSRSGGADTPMTDRSMSMRSARSLKLKVATVADSEAYILLTETLGKSPAEALRILGEVVTEHTEADDDLPVANLSSLAFGSEERYYTDAELEAVGMPHAGIYKTKRIANVPPEEIRTILKRMGKEIPPKYEGK